MLGGWRGSDRGNEAALCLLPGSSVSALLLGKLTLGAAQSVPKQQLYVIMLVAG